MASPTFREALRVWGTTGLNSFGGPAGQISVMHRELVQQRGWVSEERFAHALAFCMLLPGPEAQQLATYLGWLLHGVRGGIVAGLLFITPGILVMLGLSILYVEAGTVPIVAAVLRGLQAAVVVLVAQACGRIFQRTATTPALRLVALFSFVGIALLALPFPVIVVAAGLVGWLMGRGRPAAAVDPDELPSPGQRRSAHRAALAFALAWLLPLLALLTLPATSVLRQMGLFFSQAAVLTFGGAYAVLGYVAQQAVGTYGWISTADLASGLGLAETTPGPLVLVLEFIGFVGAYGSPDGLPPLLSGLLGALIAVWMTFVPCFLFIFAGAPYVERLRASAGLASALRGIGAAVSGVIAALALWFATHALFSDQQPFTWGPIGLDVPVWSSIEWGALLIVGIAAVLTFRFRWPTLRLIGLCAIMATGLAALGWLA